MSLDKQHVMGAAAEASEPALVSDQAPAGLAPTGFDQAQVTQADRDADEAEAFGKAYREQQLSSYGCAGAIECTFKMDGNCHCFNATLAKHRLAALEASSRQEERLRLAIAYALPLVSKDIDDAMKVRRANRDVIEELEGYERTLKAALEPPHAKDAADV